ncbi:hypothetical protein ACFQ1I_11705 [Kitasatospora arboriphila]
MTETAREGEAADGAAGRDETAGRDRAVLRAALERLRGLCLALPGAEERPSHGEAAWFAG